jgi:predicted RNA binding protein YcfA (HicA-like mRNA interferase family)
VSGRELVTILRQYGWTVDRIRGSHHILVKQGQQAIVTVPVHGNTPLKTGLLLSVLRIAGIDKAQL